MCENNNENEGKWRNNLKESNEKPMKMKKTVGVIISIINDMKEMKGNENENIRNDNIEEMTINEMTIIIIMKTYVVWRLVMMKK